MKFNEEVFDSFPVLETERLILREITPGDVREIFAIRSSEEAMKYFGHNVYTSLTEADDMINAIVNGFKNKEGIRWGITLKGSEKLIGSGGPWRLLKEHLRCEIGYDLLPQYWKKGIMTEALREIIKFCFDKMNMHSIEANVDPDNIASVKLLEKLGFEKEGHLKESFYFNDVFTDTGIYSLIRK
ncbi:MAG: GNAT family N-acetyltransferase [Ignavibacteria bacterium]|nr:GNAT family N-acetyltransferase [Ignavibacteria bacterium]